MPHSPLLVQPMRDELTQVGFRELLTSADVDEFMREKTATAMLVINSVCGCAAGMARPGVRLALQESQRPARLATVFAGQDLEATARVRSHFPDIPPSSPSIALLKEGELVYFMPRHRIEGRDAEAIARDLQEIFNAHCALSNADIVERVGM